MSLARKFVLADQASLEPGYYWIRRTMRVARLPKIGQTFTVRIPTRLHR